MTTRPSFEDDHAAAPTAAERTDPMYELAIEHEHRGLTLSLHPDRRDAGDALAAFTSQADCVERIIQLTETFSSYELVQYDDGRPIAIATIEHRNAETTTQQQVAAATLRCARRDQRADRHTWDHISGAITHRTELA